MSDDEESLSFVPGIHELVAEVETQMAVVRPPLGGSTVGLDLPELMLETSHCCQFAPRVSSSNVSGLGDLLDLVLSQEFGECKFYIRIRCKCHIVVVGSFDDVLYRVILLRRGVFAMTF